ncbi:MAG: M23 family metallopeptidase [Clostridiales bacterium]|nr:M23 family metallopeptidase [Clostridiales bacterium]
MKKVPEVILFLTFLVTISIWFSACLYQRQAALQLSADVLENAVFRKMYISERTLEKLYEQAADGIAPGEWLTVIYPFCSQGFASCPKWADSDEIDTWRWAFLRSNPDGYRVISAALAAIWDDIKCFPVLGEGIFFENTWMFERTYGGLRGHEGTDLLPPDNVTGIYPVVSMTDGVIEKIGWLEQGGYRIGIRSESGGYFYYAHLDSYARDFTVGESVYAGDCLGLMGDSGYGTEGTRGQFPVHLHLGIYIQTKQSGELSINPYWVLRYAQFL